MKTNIISDIIYSFDDLKNLIKEKLQKDVYYLMLDDYYFEQLERHTSITREIYTLIKKSSEEMGVIKYIVFNTIKDIKESYNLIQELNTQTTIFVTLFNEKEQECTMLFLENNKDSIVEREIHKFIEMED